MAEGVAVSSLSLTFEADMAACAGPHLSSHWALEIITTRKILGLAEQIQNRENSSSVSRRETLYDLLNMIKPSDKGIRYDEWRVSFKSTQQFIVGFGDCSNL